MTDCYKTMRLDDLVEDPHNARLHDMPNLTAIRASLLRFGQVEPLVVQSGTNQVVGGNGRLRVMRALGWETAEVREVDLDDKEAIALGLALNRTAELATWDETMLRAHLKTLSDADFDIGGFSLDEKELKNLNFGVEEKPEAAGKTDPDDVPEPPADPITKPGDLWILGNHRLLCGDSTNIQHVERLMDGKKADMVFTDPPYGMSLDVDFTCKPTYAIHKGKDKTRSGGSDIYNKVAGDHDDFTPDLINTVFASFPYCDEIFLWGADYYAELIPDRKNGSWVVWDKVTKADGDQSGVENFHGSNFELCWSKAKHKRELARIMHKGLASVENDKRVHPTQKPVALAEWFFERWGQGKTVIADLYGGSGSTLIACEKTSRHCRMMELEPAYCDVIVKRWEDFTGQKAVRA